LFLAPALLHLTALLLLLLSIVLPVVLPLLLLLLLLLLPSVCVLRCLQAACNCRSTTMQRCLHPPHTGRR
jgi:hypothetical protein